MKSKNYFPNIDKLIEKNKSFVEVAQHKTYYNELADVYELMSARNKETKTEVRFLKDFFEKNCENKKILDLACGVGRHSRELSKFGFEVFAIDQSEAMLKIAKKNDKKTKYTKSDIRSFSVGENFDAAFCLWTTYNYLSTESDFEKFLQCVGDALKTGGFLILESRNFFKHTKKLEFRRREHEDPRYKIELFIRKKIDLGRRIQEAIYVYLVIDKKSNKTFSSIDTELVKIYSKQDIQRLITNKYKIFSILGEYNERESYNIGQSDRLIFILQKI